MGYTFRVARLLDLYTLYYGKGEESTGVLR